MLDGGREKGRGEVIGGKDTQKGAVGEEMKRPKDQGNKVHSEKG